MITTEIPCNGESSKTQRTITLGRPVLNTELTAIKCEFNGWMGFEQFMALADHDDTFIYSITEARYKVEKENRELFGKDEVECFAKQWSSWDGDTGRWYIQRIGLGAYGDSVAFERPIHY